MGQCYAGCDRCSITRPDQWNVTAVCPRGGVGMVNGAKTDQIAAISAKSFPASSLQTGTGVSDFAQTAAVQACIVVPWGAWDRLALLETPPCPHPITFIPNLAFSVPPHAFVAGYEWRCRVLSSLAAGQQPWPPPTGRPRWPRRSHPPIIPPGHPSPPASP